MEIYANGFAQGTKAAFAVNVDGVNHVYRFDGTTINAAELAAMLFALKGTPNEGAINYYSNCKYAMQTLERGDVTWARTVINNAELVNEIRELFLTKKAFNVVFDKDSKMLLEMKKLSRAAIEVKNETAQS